MIKNLKAFLKLRKITVAQRYFQVSEVQNAGLRNVDFRYRVIRPSLCLYHIVPCRELGVSFCWYLGRPHKMKFKPLKTL